MGRTRSAQQLVWWRTDGFVCALVAAIVVALASTLGWVHRLDLAMYDAAVGSASAEPAADLVVVGIDDHSLKTLGPWPWPPEVHARLVDQLASAGARAIVYTMPLPETPARPLPAPAAAVPGEPAGTGAAPAAEVAVPTGDARLALSLQRAGNVVLVSQYAAAGPATPLPSHVRRSVLADPGAHAVPAGAGRHPPAVLGAAASAIGHLQWTPDTDGVLRQMPLLLAHDHAAVPSVALLAALRGLQLGSTDLRLQASAPWLRLGSLGIATDSTTLLRPLFHAPEGGQPAFARMSFAQALSPAAGAPGFQGKTVLVGFTSAAQATPLATPGGQMLYPVEVLAQMVSAIRHGHAVTVPDWALPVAWLAVVAALLYLALALPQVSALAGLAVSVALLLALAGAQWLALEHALLSFSLLGAALAVAVGQATMLALKLRPGGGSSRARSAEAAESQRMLGLALHGQGKLEQAFERFRRLPVTEALKDNLYHLAQDFERKRNYAMAKQVYERILRHDRQYKDAKLRYRKARARAKSASGQPDSTPPSSAPVPMPSVSAKPRLPGDVTIGLPMLGRYEISKEIGKGSMGVVYQGRDPKIGRTVAIKTLALGQEFEGDGLIDARARFFREAETAGRLQHPYIVTIFDSGEEHDLAYISMEYLKGSDLSPFCKEGNLLPVPLALSVAARVAEALDYAHANQVVHRDIKPANIMFDAATDAVKVTDFGIARLTDSNKTRTGLVLGTPSFMSPEQLAGKKVDGRTDLYSLGVTLFQMLTGSLPLRGASMPELMHKIASVPAPDVRTLRPELPAEVAAVVALSMMKRPEARYQTGRQFAAEIRGALAVLAGAESATNPRTVVYDAARKATGRDMADFQETVMEYPAQQGPSLPPSSAR